jgi:hypothetical protein
MGTDSDKLLTKINKAVAEANAVEKTMQAAQTELVSRSKAIGMLLLEAKKLHPAVKDFETFLKKVRGLKLSRAYDLLRLAGGRTTDEELRKETRDRVKKHREKKKLPERNPKPVSVTDHDVTESPKRITESPEVSAEERRAQMAALDVDLSIPPFLDRSDEAPAPEQQAEFDRERQSRRALAEFVVACKRLLPLLVEADWTEAVCFFDDCVERCKRRAA